MEFHMYAQTACTVADCITLLLSRKAKLKGENPPPAKPCISIFSHGPRIGVRQISVFVCQTPTFSPCAVSLIVIPLLTLCCFLSCSSLSFIFCRQCVFRFCSVFVSLPTFCLSVCFHISLFLCSIYLSAISLCFPFCHICAAAQEDITPTLL